VTVNINVAKEKRLAFDEILVELSRLEIRGIRVNFAKVELDEMMAYGEKILQYLVKYKKRFEFIFDVPFPTSKIRVISADTTTIKKGDRYILTSNKHCYEKNTLVTSGSFSEISCENKTIYYGDGEGGFTVNKRFADGSYEIIAENSFNILLNRAITCGVSEHDDMRIMNSIIDMCDSYDVRCMYAFSFVENEKYISSYYNRISGIISKIETQKGVDFLPNIVKFSDGIMIARGDLALFADHINLLKNIDIISQAAKSSKKRLFVATDLLKSMRNRLMPSRSDLVDISYMAHIGISDVILSDDFSTAEAMSKLEHIVKLIKRISDIYSKEI